MDVGVGLPSTIPGAGREQLLDWARHAEAQSFSSLGVFSRAARYADGWIMGGGTPGQLAEGAAKTRGAWEAAGREGAPRTMALGYFALGDGAQEAARGYLGDYYAFLGDFADRVVAGAATDADTVKRNVDAFAEAGCDELVLYPCNPDPGQVDLLADALA